MKKLINISIIALFAFFISCSEQNDSVMDEMSFASYNKETIQDAPLAAKVAYQDYHLLKIAKWVAKNYKKQVIKNAIELSVDEESKTTPKILVTELISSFQSRSTNSNHNANVEEIKESLEAFSSLKNGSWLPTISMPIEVKVASRTLDESEPIFVIDKPESNTPTIGIEGYQLKDNGDFEIVDQQITEEIAGRVSTFVIKLNSYSDEDGGGGGSGGGGSGGGSGSGGFSDNVPFIGTLGGGPSYSSPPGLKIKWMQVKQHKEEWWNGASEINIVCFVENEFPTYSGFCGNYITASSNCYNYDGKQIRSASECDIDNNVFSVCDAVLNSTTNFNGTVIYYIIFEHDGTDWLGNHENIEAFTFPNGQVRNLQYRSYQSYYAKGMFSVASSSANFPNISNAGVDNSGIKFTLNY